MDGAVCELLIGTAGPKPKYRNKLVRAKENEAMKTENRGQGEK